MNMIDTSAQTSGLPAVERRLLKCGMSGFAAFSASAMRLRRALLTLQKLGDEVTARRAARLIHQLDALEPSVTMIGQIKSGKTSLVNALVGYPDLLPADVNPWTTVVTSLHLNPETPGFRNSASFRFFDADEWDKLISGGGRIGELASRAGADEELDKIRAQVAAMREKSRLRLGRKFEVMLGQQREYGYFDKDLIERYVCLGDGDNSADRDQQGRFADITRSADLHLQRPGLPLKLCIRDTPGVNDTFMMREQITIKSIRDSRICVVVLSAHQALSSTDMALIRLISNVKSRDVIIFVNRIDELSDPAEQIPAIRASILATLERHKGPTDAQILFGSAMWATCALRAHLDELPTQSATALFNWADAPQNKELSSDDSELLAWKLSGLPALLTTIGDRITTGVGEATLRRIAESAANLGSGLSAADRMKSAQNETTKQPRLDPSVAVEELQRELADHQLAMKARMDEIVKGFGTRVARAQTSFLDRATSALLNHLEKYGEAAPWTYDPAGLRVLLSSAHKVLVANSSKAFEDIAQSAAQTVATNYQRAFGLGADSIQIRTPAPPRATPPVLLGQTIALDLNSAWWKRWWSQRRGYKAFTANYLALIQSETGPFVDELRVTMANEIRDSFCTSLNSFLAEQNDVFQTLAQKMLSNPDDAINAIPGKVAENRRALLHEALEIMDEYC